MTSLSSTDRLVSSTCWKWGEALFILLSLCNSYCSHTEQVWKRITVFYLCSIFTCLKCLFFCASHLCVPTKHLPHSASSPARSGTRHKHNPSSQRNCVNRRSWKYRSMQPKVTKALINHATKAGVHSSAGIVRSLNLLSERVCTGLKFRLRTQLQS